MTSNPIVLSRGAVRSARGFTLVEILVVVVILAVLAAIVVPQFTSAASSARDSSLQMDLNRIRTQLQIYQQQHDGRWPELAKFADQMTQASDPTGQTAAVGTTGYLLGPYLREVPPNPNSGGMSLSNGAAGSSDWYYDETTGDFRANDSEVSRVF